MTLQRHLWRYIEDIEDIRPKHVHVKVQGLNYQMSVLYNIYLYEVEEMKKRLPNKLADNVTEDYWLLQEGSK